MRRTNVGLLIDGPNRIFAAGSDPTDGPFETPVRIRTMAKLATESPVANDYAPTMPDLDRLHGSRTRPSAA